MATTPPRMRPWYALILGLAGGMLKLIAPGTVRGAEHIPRSGSFILASNHFSFFEPPILAVSAPREIHFMAKKSLFGIPLFGSLIRSVNAIPINRGSADVAGLNQAVALLQGGEPLLIFPEGGRNKTGRLKEAKGGIGYLVLATGLPVIPAYVHNSNQILQCFLRTRKISVSFGPPLLPDPGWNNLERKEAHRRIGTAVMDRIAALEREALSRESAQD